MPDDGRIYETKDIQGETYKRFDTSPSRQFIAQVSDELGLHTREEITQKRRWTEAQASVLIVTLGLRLAITWDADDIHHMIATGTLPEVLQEAITELHRQKVVDTGLNASTQEAVEAA